MRGLVVAACAVAAASAAAQTVYPSAASVPANLLRLSIVFDRPQKADVGSAVRLTTAAGVDVLGAFYPAILWSPDRRTLTLYLDPGRVKTGLDVREANGAVLMVDQRIQIRLGNAVLRRWTVGAARNAPLRPGRSVRGGPRQGTRDPLSLTFATPIDWQGRDLVAVAGPDGRRIDGTASLAAGETRWIFVPATPWASGRHVIRLNEDLEDPEGNRLGTAFETGRIEEGRSAGEFDRPFWVH